jgi:acyl dehydratase
MCAVSVAQLRAGLELGPSSWIEVPQARIDAFAQAIDDRGSIHVDEELAANGPYGTTVAHGFLTLSLLPAACDEVIPLDTTIAVVYGLNRVRFPAPVFAGSRVRASFRIDELAPVDGGVQVTMTATVEREGSEKPVCVAELIFRYVE